MIYIVMHLSFSCRGGQGVEKDELELEFLEWDVKSQIKQK